MSFRSGRSVWCETLPLASLVERSVTSLLRRYDLDVWVAFRPWDLPVARGTVARLQDEGIRVGAWPMIEDEAGRWLSVTNAAPFGDFCRRLLDALGPCAPERVLLDLEPPFTWVKGTLDRTRGASGKGTQNGGLVPSAEAWESGARAIAGLATDLRERRLLTTVAVAPFLAFERQSRSFERGLGTPIPPFVHVNVMAYSSLYEGFSRGLLRRADAACLLERTAAAAVSRWREGSSVSVGVVGTGALTDEPIYRDPSELRDDMARVTRAGARHVALFDLAGILRRPPAEAWLDAFTEPQAASEVLSTWRAEMAARTLSVASLALRAFLGSDHA